MYVRSFEVQFMQYDEFVADKILWFYVPPVLLVIGTLGNLFAFCILMRSVRNVTTYCYLSTLAIMDLLVLYVGLLRRWLGEFDEDLKNKSDFLCKSVTFLGYVASDSSVWLIIAVTIERAIVVMFPLKAARVSNFRYARLCIANTIILFILVNCHFLWSMELHEIVLNDTVYARCAPKDNYTMLYDVIWPWVDAGIYSFIPFVIILILNCLIIKQVIKARRKRVILQQQFVTNKRNRIVRFSQPYDETSRKITFMLLAVSFTFLLTTLPSNIVLIYKSFFVDITADDRTFLTTGLLDTIATLLMYTNHSINFFLYCATGRRFRTQFRQIVCCCCIQNLIQRFRRCSKKPCRGSFKLYRMNTATTGQRTLYIESDNVRVKAGTLL